MYGGGSRGGGNDRGGRGRGRGRGGRGRGRGGGRGGGGDGSTWRRTPATTTTTPTTTPSSFSSTLARDWHDIVEAQRASDVATGWFSRGGNSLESYFSDRRRLSSSSSSSTSLDRLSGVGNDGLVNRSRSLLRLDAGGAATRWSGGHVPVKVRRVTAAATEGGGIDATSTTTTTALNRDESERLLQRTLDMSRQTTRLLFGADVASRGDEKSRTLARTPAPPPARRQTLEYWLDHRPEPPSLASDQVQVMRAVARGENVFFTGGAGTGKTYLLKLIVPFLRDQGAEVAVASPTATSARLIQASTLHAFLGVSHQLPSVWDMTTRLRRSPFSPRTRRWRDVEVLVIDEISMVSREFLEFIDGVARGIRFRGQHLPFGGIQMVVSGDFFQLPPVVTAVDRARIDARRVRALTFHPSPRPAPPPPPPPPSTGKKRKRGEEGGDGVDGGGGVKEAAAAAAEETAQERVVRETLDSTKFKQRAKDSEKETLFGDDSKQFCFQSPVWSLAFPRSRVHNLSTVFRQRDDRPNARAFIQCLNEVRVGRLTPESEALLKTRCVPCPDDDVVRLTTHRRQTESHNQARLNALAGPTVTFDAMVAAAAVTMVVPPPPPPVGDHAPAAAAAPELSDQDSQRLLRECPSGSRLVLKRGARVMLCVNLDVASGLVNGATGTVVAMDGPMRRVRVRFDDGVGEQTIEAYVWTDETMGGGRVSQVPLVLAWSLTIHKSQGASLSRAVIDVEQAFEAGQIYVALSRVCSLDGLYIQSWSPSRIWADSSVLRYYAHLM